MREASAEPGTSNHRLEALFAPRSVAVLGVTQTPGTVPHDIFANILAGGYRGRLYPVAPGKRDVLGVPAYRYVVDIEEAVDLAVIVFPAAVCDKALEQCGRKGIRSAIIISAGFREAGAAGVAREARIQEICREHSIALVGPNCLGVINADPAVGLNASFARKMPSAGRIAFLSQSGALCTAVLDYARDKAIGFSKFVSFGNKAGVTEVELVRHLHDDPQTDVILLYLEDLRDGRALLEAAREVTCGERPKPILAIKSGRTEQGARAAASHTGSLAGEDAVCDSVFRQAGIIRAATIEELFNSAILLTGQPAPAGPRLAIVTNAGGPGVMATDAAAAAGLEIARFEPATTAKLKAALPAAANLSNPVDVIGDARADRYRSALEAVLADPNVDEVLVILTPQSMTDIEGVAREVAGVRAGAGKLLCASFMGSHDVAAGVRILQASGVPHYTLPEWACKALADAERVRQWRLNPATFPAPLPVDRAAAAGVLDAAPEGYLSETEAVVVLKAYGLPVPDFAFCRGEDEVAAAAERLGYPAVLRLQSRQIIHKTEAQAVALNLPDASAVRAAYRRMTEHAARTLPQARVEGAIIRRMIAGSHEVILGAKRDPAFGPVLMFGLGGIFVEVFRDVTFALAPIAPATADRMIRQVRSFLLLEGARGTARADLEGLRECLIRLGQLASDFPRIVELDINPLFVGPPPGGCAVADVRIRLETPKEKP